ncbi:MerR family transcriptional regulator [Phytoactinopolyspora mesophila]|uniref:MerR family transcriptional regulator n=1 Tax=Phytoactinopolyspora mesophila TaxID=2650750 RepID=A0A7K3M924_9ACTN|nr:MerR family transcriptional regulator [Phytoactinopolyspora mesophila]NDL59477.1 MerR family transcriptional regulator [Phytoactinopolyspora mesophila]
MKIGELSQRTGVSVRALRYYEEKGALKPRRTPSGYRIFDDHAVRTVGQIQTLLSAGLGLDIISEILACMSDDSPMLDGCRERLLGERQRMTADLERIGSAVSMLNTLLDEPEPGSAGRRIASRPPAW